MDSFEKSVESESTTIGPRPIGVADLVGGRIFEHTKSGKKYLYLATGKWEADQKYVAIYQCVDTKQVWVRPVLVFIQRFRVPAQVFTMPSTRQELVTMEKSE